MHHRDRALAVQMRMSVNLGHPPMRGPAGVRVAHIARRAHLGQIPVRARDLAHFLKRGKVFIPALDAKTETVIAAVFHALEPGNQNRKRLPFANVADDAAHKSLNNFQFPIFNFQKFSMIQY